MKYLLSDSKNIYHEYSVISTASNYLEIIECHSHYVSYNSDKILKLNLNVARYLVKQRKNNSRYCHYLFELYIVPKI